MIISTNVNFVKKALLTSTALVASFVAVPVFANANVVDGTFVEGSGTFTNTDNKTTITVHDRNTIANFNEYNIGAGQGVHYQHDLGVGSANHLSRVTGGSESRILGSLTSDKVNVYLINPNGIFFGANSKVNVPNLVASTVDISNENFVARDFKFNKTGASGAKVVNNGEITIQDSGLAALVAPGVENNGVIIAKEGQVHLASADEFTLDMYGDKLINFAVTKAAKDGYVKQTGKISATDGIVALTTQDANDVVNGVINMDGIIEADTVTIKGGDIVLGSSSEIIAKNSNGAGGTAIVIAQKSLRADGNIDARATGDNKGGFVDTSAQELYIADTIKVNTSSETGEYGEWLIDPTNFTIGSGLNGANYMNNLFLGLALTNNNITLQTNPAGVEDGDINVTANVRKVFGSRTKLTLIAADDINIASGVTIRGTNNIFGTHILDVNLRAADVITNNGSIITNGGDFVAGNGASSANNFTNNGILNTGAGDVTVNANLIRLNTGITGDNIALNTGALGRIELDAKLTANTVSSDTNRVDVISDDATINQAIQLVNVGGIVNLGADTFDESVLVNKNINLVGGTLGGESIIKPTSQATLTNEFRSSYDWNEINKAIILVQNTSANVSGITVDGSGVSTGYLNGVQYERLVGIGHDNASGVIAQVKVKNIADDAQKRSTAIFADSNSKYNDKTGGGAGFTGTNIASADAANDVVILTSEITNYQYQGVNANGDALTAGMYLNTVASPEAAVGVNYSRGTKGYIVQNNIANNAALPAPFAGNSANIMLDRAGDDILVLSNTITGNGKGIGIQAISTNNAIISNNDVQNEQTGIYLFAANGTKVDRNNIQNNGDGVIALMANNGDFSDNIITNNADNGVRLLLSNNNSFSGDNVSGNGTGIYIFGSDFTSIDEAQINNNGVGVDILGSSEDSIVTSDNTIITNSNIGGEGNIGLRADGVNGPITLTLDNVIFTGAQTDSAITFQNATTVDGVIVNDVQLLSTAPVGWQFTNVTGGAVTDVLDAGDMNFGNTVFGDTYTVQDIVLTNSLMDGDASNATFVNDAGDPFAREDRVFHTLDLASEGTIFYNGLDIVSGFGNLFGNIASRTDLKQVYYNEVSTAGRAFDTPSIDGVAEPQTFNTTKDFKVSLAGNPTPLPIQLADASDLNDLQTAAGADGSDLQDLETAAGADTTCEVNFANNFLDEDVILANATGSCGANAGVTSLQ